MKLISKHQKKSPIIFSPTQIAEFESREQVQADNTRVEKPKLIKKKTKGEIAAEENEKRKQDKRPIEIKEKERIERSIKQDQKKNLVGNTAGAIADGIAGARMIYSFYNPLFGASTYGAQNLYGIGHGLATGNSEETKFNLAMLPTVTFRLPSGKIIERSAINIGETFGENWFNLRNPKYVTKQDIKTLQSHHPEYSDIQADALHNQTFLEVPKGTINSTTLDDGRTIFLGDPAQWLQMQSESWKKAFEKGTTVVGYKGGVDQKIVGSTHAPETFPIQKNGVFFAADPKYAAEYSQGHYVPSFYLNFRRPYDMRQPGVPKFPLEDMNVAIARVTDVNPKTVEVINRNWNSSYLENPEMMKLISANPVLLNSEQQAKRVQLLKQIRTSQNPEMIDMFRTNIQKGYETGKYHPGIKYDGFIGRDHALGFGFNPKTGEIRDYQWSYGSNPETYVITHPNQAKLVIGNNGDFDTTINTYSRKLGGILNVNI